TVGLRPTTPLALAGEMMEPEVSVPIAAAHELDAAATPDPELEPDGWRSYAFGLCVCPPRPLQPLVERDDRKLAHSLRFVLPRMTTPASRSFFTIIQSRGGFPP